VGEGSVPLMNKKRYETGYTKYLLDNEFKQIIAYISSKESPSLKMLLKVMIILGLRVGEAKKLKRQNFNQDFSILNYVMLKSKKIKDRRIPVQLQKELKDYYKNYSCRMVRDYLFFANYRHKRHNEHLQATTIRVFFQKLRQDLNLNQVYYTCRDGKKLYRISPHTLRHYALYRYYKASNNDLITTSKIIGHTHTETTARYINAVEVINNELSIVDKAFNDKVLSAW